MAFLHRQLEARIGGKGHIDHLVAALAPAVEYTRSCDGEDPVEAGIDFDIRSEAGQLEAAEPVMVQVVATRGVRVVPAIYRLERGKVALLE